MLIQTPTLHKSIPVGTRVVVSKSTAGDVHMEGKVIGISMVHMIFFYIVLLDTPIECDATGEMVQGVTVPGTELETPDGENWKIDWEFGRPLVKN